MECLEELMKIVVQGVITSGGMCIEEVMLNLIPALTSISISQWWTVVKNRWHFVEAPV